MGVIFKLIGFLIVVGGLFGIGFYLGGSVATGMATDVAVVTIKTCASEAPGDQAHLETCFVKAQANG